MRCPCLIMVEVVKGTIFANIPVLTSMFIRAVFLHYYL